MFLKSLDNYRNLGNIFSNLGVKVKTQILWLGRPQRLQNYRYSIYVIHIPSITNTVYKPEHLPLLIGVIFVPSRQADLSSSHIPLK